MRRASCRDTQMPLSFSCGSLPPERRHAVIHTISGPRHDTRRRLHYGSTDPAGAPALDRLHRHHATRRRSMSCWPRTRSSTHRRSSPRSRAAPRPTAKYLNAAAKLFGGTDFRYVEQWHGRELGDPGVPRHPRRYRGRRHRHDPLERGRQDRLVQGDDRPFEGTAGGHTADGGAARRAGPSSWAVRRRARTPARRSSCPGPPLRP